MNEELEKAVKKLLAMGIKPAQLRRAQRKVCPVRQYRRPRWRYEQQKPGPCRTLTVDEVRALGLVPSEDYGRK